MIAYNCFKQSNQNQGKKNREINYIPEASNCFFMRLEHLDIVHVGLPVFAIPRMIACYHPGIII